MRGPWDTHGTWRGRDHRLPQGSTCTSMVMKSEKHLSHPCLPAGPQPCPANPSQALRDWLLEWSPSWQLKALLTLGSRLLWLCPYPTTLPTGLLCSSKAGKEALNEQASKGDSLRASPSRLPSNSCAGATTHSLNYCSALHAFAFPEANKARDSKPGSQRRPGLWPPGSRALQLTLGMGSLSGPP